MKLALFTLMSCLIALSWQQHHHYRQPVANSYWPLPYHHQQQQLPSYYQEPHQNYPSYNPYYRGPYSPSNQPIYPDYYQPQQQQQVPKRSQVDEIKLMALLSQLNQQQQPQQQQKSEKQDSRQKELDLDLLNQLNKDSVFIAQHQDIDSPPTDQQSVQQTFSNFDESETNNGKTEDSNSQDSTHQSQQNQQQVAAGPGEVEGRAKLAALLLGYQIFTTSTSYKFVTSTVTTTNYISCIVSASFYGGSTQACRRKRFVADIEADQDQMPFNPSPVDSVEPTAIYDELERHSRSAELLSSFNEQFEDGAKMPHYDSFVRANRGIGLGTTLTSTITSYSFTTTASYKTIKIGSSLSCLPSGYSIC